MIHFWAILAMIKRSASSDQLNERKKARWRGGVATAASTHGSEAMLALYVGDKAQDLVEGLGIGVKVLGVWV